MSHELLQPEGVQPTVSGPLLSSFVTDEVTTERGEDVVLIQTMRLAVAADGAINEREMAKLSALSLVLPQLRSRQPDEISALLRLPVNAAEYTRRVRGMSASLRAQCFAIAVDLSLASGDGVASLDANLEMLRGVLEIPLADAEATIVALGMKYGRRRRAP